MRLSALVLSAVVIAASAVPALAQPPVPVVPSPQSQPQPESTAADSAADRESPVDRHCLKETGTRIRARAGERRCTAFAGRVYSREDIERTGEIDLASALRRLDAAIH